MPTTRNLHRSKVRAPRRLYAELCENLEQRILFSMTFKITYDKTVTALPNLSTIQSAVNNAVTQLATAFSNTITLNITIAAGTIAPSAPNPIQGGSLTVASANPTYQGISYPTLVADLRAHHTTADRASAVADLAGLNPTGAGSFTLATAEAKALGVKTTAKSDGTLTFNATAAYTYNASQRATAGKIDFIGVIIDGFSKIMGRTVSQGSGNTPTYHPYDLFRFTGPGLNSYSTDTSYFSVDGGTTNLNFFSDNNDAADWATPIAPATLVPDVFNDDMSTNTRNDLTEADRKVMDVLGYTRADVPLLPDHVGFVTQPKNTDAGHFINPLTVQLLDINGNPSLISGETITLSETNGLVTITSGDTATTDAFGQAIFNQVLINTPGTFLTLTATDIALNLTSPPSQPFGVFTPSTYLDTHTTLTTLPNPSTYGDDVTLSATIGSSVTPAAGTLVSFYDNGVLLGSNPTNALGAATFDTTVLTAGLHALTAVYAGDTGFNASTSAFQVQTVNKAALTVLGMTVQNKVYDSTTAGVVGTGVPLLLGVIGLDDVATDITNATATFASKAVGTGVTANIGGIVLTGTTAANYILVPPTATADITPRPLSAVIVTAANKLYDGNTSATILTRTLSNVLPGDVALAIGGTASFADAAVGTNKVVNVSGLTLTGASAGNYSISPTAVTHASILNSAPPVAPSGVASTALSSSSIRTTWNLNGSTETGVYVIRWNGAAWVTIGTLGAGANTFTDTNLAPNTTYIYDVIAFNSFGNTYATAYSSAKTAVQVAPGAPTGLSATALSAYAVRVNWTLNGAADSGVIVVRWNGTAWIAIANLAAGTTTYTDTTASPLTTYHYDVVDYNAAGQTWALDYTTATTLSAPVGPPAAPSDITTSVLSTTSVRVNWNLHGGSETAVYVAKWNGTTFQIIAALAVGTTTYTDNSATHGANLYIVITANQFGQTYASAYATAVIS